MNKYKNVLLELVQHFSAFHIYYDWLVTLNLPSLLYIDGKEWIYYDNSNVRFQCNLHEPTAKLSAT